MNIKTRIICGAVVLALSGCGGAFQNSTNQVSEEEMAYSRTVTLTKGDLESTVDVTGVVVSAVETEVTTDLTSKVVKLNVKEGDKVKKGDVIAVLDTSELERELKDLKEGSSSGGGGPSASAVEHAKKVLEKAEQAEEIAKKRFEKRYNKTTDEYKDIAIENKYAKLQDTLDKANQALVKADSSVTDKQLAVEKAQTEYDQAGVRVKLDQRIADVSDATKAVEDSQKAADDAKYYRDHASVEYNLDPSEENKKKLDDAEKALKEADDALEEAEKALTKAESELERAKNKIKDKEDALNKAKAELEKAEQSAKYQQAKKAYDNAAAALDEYEKAIYKQYAQDKEDVEKAIDETIQAKGSLDDLYGGGGGSSSNKSQIEEVENKIKSATLRAESSGEVTSLKVKLGSRPEGSVATIQSTDKLIFQVSIPEESINKVRKGLSVTVTAASISEPVTGKLTQISSTTGATTNPDTGNVEGGDGSGYKAQITLDEAGGLHIGSKAAGSIILSSKKNVFIVPVDAVGNDEGLSYIRAVQEDGTYKKIAVEVGDSNETMVEIIGDSLVEGMEILSDAYYEDLITDAKAESEGN